jgi:elongation factor 1 alpha-like protein
MAYDDDDVYDDYEDDDYDEGADGLTSEDKEQLRLGLIRVRESLGDSIAATDEEIQEALWHYYYDVAKSVAFVKSMRIL